MVCSARQGSDTTGGIFSSCRSIVSVYSQYNELHPADQTASARFVPVTHVATVTTSISAIPATRQRKMIALKEHLYTTLFLSHCISLLPTMASNEVTIVRAKLEDAAAIEAIVKAAYSKYVERIGHPPAPMLVDYERLVLSQDVYILKPSAGERLLGSIVLTVDDKDKSIEVNNLVVEPAAQGHGYGRVLMDHAYKVAKENGCDAITLFTNVKMHENIGLYARLGFVETGRRIEGPYERLYFRKSLIKD